MTQDWSFCWLHMWR